MTNLSPMSFLWSSGIVTGAHTVILPLEHSSHCLECSFGQRLGEDVHNLIFGPNLLNVEDAFLAGWCPDVAFKEMILCGIVL